MKWYSYKYRYNGQPPRQDNKNYYSGRGKATNIPEHSDRWYAYHWHDYSAIRVPSIKRGKSTWKRFYRLFPQLRYMDSFCGHPLKKI